MVEIRWILKQQQLDDRHDQTWLQKWWFRCYQCLRALNATTLGMSQQQFFDTPPKSVYKLKPSEMLYLWKWKPLPPTNWNIDIKHIQKWPYSKGVAFSKPFWARNLDPGWACQRVAHYAGTGRCFVYFCEVKKMDSPRAIFWVAHVYSYIYI